MFLFSFCQKIDYYYPVYDEYYSRIEVSLSLARLPEYYEQKIFLGCILLVIMSLALYALNIDEPDRMMGQDSFLFSLLSLSLC